MIGKTIIITLAAFALMLFSCAATLPEDAPPDIKWPMPPARTRIQFVDYIIGSNDVVANSNSKTKSLLFGDAKEIKLSKPTFPFYKNGVLYVSDLEQVMAFDFANNKFWTIGSGYLRNATGLAVLSDDTVYVGDSVQKCIFVVRPGSKEPERITDFKMFTTVGGIDVNEKRGWIYVADPKGHNIKVIDFNGKLQFTIGYRGVGRGEFNFPYDVKVGPGGRIYVSDSGNFRVQIFDGEGIFLGMFGGIGTKFGSFARPKGLALDKDGNIYVLDSAFGNFQVFNQRGKLLLAVGTIGRDPGMHILPVGIYINDENKIFVAEHGNRRIQIYRYFSYDDEKKFPPPPLRSIPRK